MKLSEQATRDISQREIDEQHNAFNKSANDKKRVVYWIGFLEGALASDRIELGENDALHAEATKFAEFFGDPDASDLAEDIDARCFSSDSDMMDQLKQIVLEKRAQISTKSPYTETDEMNEFLGFCAGVICDGRILASEASAILHRFQKSDLLMNASPFQDVRRVVEASLADNELTASESEEIQEWISRLVGDGFIDTGLPNIGTVAQLDEPITDPNMVSLSGSTFVLTGPMKIGTRAFIVAEIERFGAVFQERTTRETAYVVVSSTASKHWRTTHFGRKIERAQQLLSQGYDLQFVSEDALQGAIRLADGRS
ncbi:MAG: hypothetical protein P1U69_10125 [Parvibaculaceae bacterium]|nr:hypothetical protein [Parvibaculaceae bacterium]